MYQNTKAARQAVIDACLRMNAEGINQGTSGNISLRIDDEMLITPSGMAYDAMQVDDLVRIPLTGEATPRGGRIPSSEWQFHRAVLQARPDVQAVVHAHPTACTALAMLRQSIPPCHYMIAIFGGGDVPLVDYALFGSEALAQNVVHGLGARHGCILSNHGAITVGDTLERAFWRMGELEALARSYLAAKAVGEVVLLSDPR